MQPNMLHGIGDSPTQLVREILKCRDPSRDNRNAGNEDTAANVMTVMLRVQAPPASLLVVDTELCDSLRLALHNAGFEVTVAETADDALEALSIRHHALAVTDRLGLVRSFRDRGTGRLLQIILIGGREQCAMEAALDAGADDFVDARGSEALLQARLSSARRMSNLESALRAAFTEGRRLAMTDELTGVANRRFFAAHYPREIARAARYASAAAVAMCDIDHFKRINDRCGHAAGDEVLRQFAQRLQSCLRHGTDWIARVGGEEFAVVMPEADLEEAMSICQKLRATVSDSPFNGKSMETRVTASFGLAAIDGMPRDPKRIAERLLSAADRALYRSKAAGRDRVTAVKLRFGRR